MADFKRGLGCVGMGSIILHSVLVPTRHNPMPPMTLTEKIMAKHSGKAKSTWILFAEDALRATVDHLPRREEIPTIANEQMVVELYAK